MHPLAPSPNVRHPSSVCLFWSIGGDDAGSSAGCDCRVDCCDCRCDCAGVEAFSLSLLCAEEDLEEPASYGGGGSIRGKLAGAPWATGGEVVDLSLPIVNGSV